jgi:hypothetical protein
MDQDSHEDRLAALLRADHRDQPGIHLAEMHR